MSLFTFQMQHHRHMNRHAIRFFFFFFNLGMTWQDLFALNFYTGNLLTQKVAKKESSNTVDSVGSACLGLVHICRWDDLKRASSGKDARRIDLTGKGFVCLASLTVIPGCLARCFASRTRCQTRRLLPSQIRFLTRRDTLWKQPFSQERRMALCMQRFRKESAELKNWI